MGKLYFLAPMLDAKVIPTAFLLQLLKDDRIERPSSLFVGCCTCYTGLRKVLIRLGTLVLALVNVFATFGFLLWGPCEVGLVFFEGFDAVVLLFPLYNFEFFLAIS